MGIYRNELDLDPNNEKKYNINIEWVYHTPLFNHRLNT